MSAAARTVAPRLAAPAPSTGPRPVAPAAPASKSIPISAETLARIEAVLATDRGETVAAFVAKAVLHELGVREGARAFRRASWFAEAPAAIGHRDIKPDNMSPCSFVAPSDGAAELPLIPDLEAPSARPARARDA